MINMLSADSTHLYIKLLCDSTGGIFTGLIRHAYG